MVSRMTCFFVIRERWGVLTQHFCSCSPIDAWLGEFLDAARDDSRWKGATAMVRNKTGGIAFDVVKELLLHLAKSAVFGGS